MRTQNDICLLCKESRATQKNSHLIPRFFGKGLFETRNPRHGIEINKDGKRRRVQDIVKEDYLVCPGCERGFSILETYCSLRLERFNKLRYYQEFKRFKIGEFEYFECKNLDIKIFNLFIYSIIWRLSVSSTYAFGAFSLPKIHEEELRSILSNYIVKTQEDLISSITDLIALPNYSHITIRPHKKLRPPNSMLSAASLGDYLHEIFLVDYLILFLTDSDKTESQLKEIDNNNLDKLVRIGLVSVDNWKKYNYTSIKEALR